MHHRFHHTRTGEGFIAYDRIRPIQSAKRCATEGEAIAMVEKMKKDEAQRETATEHPKGG